MSNIDVGAIGIDFGSSRSVIGVARKKGVDIIANEASNRETLNVVGYGTNERMMGEQGYQQQKGNFKNTIRFFSRLLGIPSNYPSLRQETKWISSQIGTNSQGKLVHKVNYQGQNLELLPEQVTASFLGKLKNIIRQNNLADKEAVLSVPNYYTEQEKKSLLDACKIADLNVTRLVSEAYAITTSYGIFRRQELKDLKDPRNVIFVDIGHSKFSTFVGSFTKEKAQIIAQVNDRELGVRDMDWVLLNYYSQKFDNETNGLVIFENKKAVVRTLDAIDKQRKMLSSNSEAPINVEYLIEENDLNYTMKREEFETLIAPVLDKFKQRCNELHEFIVDKKLDIHSVEIIGGGSRIPIVQQIIAETFKKDNIMKTLNASETIARGCATIAAVLSPEFHVIPYAVEEQNYHPIKVEWKFVNKEMDIEPKQSTLFSKGCTIPNIKSLTFKQSDEINIRLYYDPVPAGFSESLGSLVIPAQKPKEQEYHTKVRIKLNENGILQLTDANLIEEYIIEEKVEIKKKPEEQPKPTDPSVQVQQQAQNGQQQPQQQMETEAQEGASQQQKTDPVKEVPQQPIKEEPQFEIKKKNKSRTTAINPTCQSTFHLPKKDIDDFFQLEVNMADQDRIIHDTQFKKNQLEAYMYNMKDKIVLGFLKDYTDPKLIPTIQQKLQEYQTWLYNEGQDVNKSQYVQKREELEQLCEPSVKRFRDEESYQYSVEELIRVCDIYEKFVFNEEEKYFHISLEAKKNVEQEVIKCREWLHQANSAVQNRIKSNELPVTSTQIEERIKILQNICKPIMNTPKPEPKKEPEIVTPNTQNNNNSNDSEGVKEETQNQQEQQDNNQQQDDKMDVEI